MKAHIDHVIAREREALFALNGWIFDKHELSCQEYETSQRVVDFLRDKAIRWNIPSTASTPLSSPPCPAGSPGGGKSPF